MNNKSQRPLWLHMDEGKPMPLSACCQSANAAVNPKKRSFLRLSVEA